MFRDLEDNVVGCGYGGKQPPHMASREKFGEDEDDAEDNLDEIEVIR